MNAKVIKSLKLKAKRYAEANTLSEREEKRAYQVLKQMYKESSKEERKALDL